ncbi:MAG: M4 family metallopeptidase [Bdellovibrionota bacterium]
MKKTIPYLSIIFLFIACGVPDNNSQLSSKSSDSLQLKRFDESDFSPVIRNTYFAGLTNPLLNLPRNGERGILIYHNGEESLDVKNARRLARIFGKKVTIPHNSIIAETKSKEVLRFYREQFARNSYDGLGAAINISADVNKAFPGDPQFRHNAMWIEEKQILLFGAGGREFDSFIKGTDVVGHEFTHAVISTTSRLEYIGQSGALNEHFADVFGEMFQQYIEPTNKPFLIGETITLDKLPLRNMLDPQSGLSKQPGHIQDIPEEFGPDCKPSPTNDSCGVHILSGIPNRFAALAIKELGWLKTRDIFYNVMTERLNSQANFSDYADAILNECYQIKLSDTDCSVIEKSLHTVGL